MLISRAWNNILFQSLYKIIMFDTVDMLLLYSALTHFSYKCCTFSPMHLKSCFVYACELICIMTVLCSNNFDSSDFSLLCHKTKTLSLLCHVKNYGCSLPTQGHLHFQYTGWTILIWILITTQHRTSPSGSHEQPPPQTLATSTFLSCLSWPQLLTLSTLHPPPLSL